MSEKDLQLAFRTIRAKQQPYTDLFNYYDGEQPLVYTSRRLTEIFKDLDAYFAENWCSVVIDSTQDRVNLRGIEIEGAGRNAWHELYEASEINLESDDVHEAALVAGEGYFIAWPDEKGVMQGYHNDPRLVHLFYEYSNPRVKRFAAKMWAGEDKRMNMTLYYPDHLEYYLSTNTAENVMDGASFLATDDPIAPNPFGEVPVFHYRTGKRKVKSDLKNVIPMQNGINKLLTDMMVTAEFLAFPQRYIISNADVQGKLKNSPNEVWDLPAGDGIGQQTQAGQFEAAKLDNYLRSIDSLATAISSITRTPKHYFFQVGSNLSGEALIAMEAPLNKKAQDRIDRFEPVWKQVTEFMCRAQNIPVKDVHVNFDRPETIQPRTQAETRQMNVNAGMSLITVWREEGKDETWIKQALRDMEMDAARGQMSLGKSLLDAERKFNAPDASVTDNSSDSAVSDEEVASD
jgi:hypothetical protein